MPSPETRTEHTDHTADLREKMTAALAKLTVRRTSAIAHHGVIQGEAARRAEHMRREQEILHGHLASETGLTSDDGDHLERTAFARGMYEQIAGGAAPGPKPTKRGT